MSTTYYLFCVCVEERLLYTEILGWACLEWLQAFVLGLGGEGWGWGWGWAVGAKFVVWEALFSVYFEFELSVVDVIIVYEDNRWMFLNMENLGHPRRKFTYIRLRSLQSS